MTARPMASSTARASLSFGRSMLRGTPRLARARPSPSVRQLKAMANVPKSAVVSDRATRITSRKLLALLRAWSTRTAKPRRADAEPNRDTAGD